MPVRKGAVAGARAKAAGDSLERALTAVNSWYDDRGEAFIEKVNPPTFGWGETLGLGTSTVDYTGTWDRPRSGPLRDGVPWAGGRVGITFDAKSITGKVRIGVEEIQSGRKLQDVARERARFMRQVGYLQGARERHGYAAFLLLYCAELDTLWLCDRLDELAAKKSVEIRTITGRGPTRSVTHHLPHLTNPGNPLSLLALAAVPRIDTRRPHLDYLSLLEQR